MTERDEWLRLDNQICFPFYAISRLITRAYQPLLKTLDITYPQYLVLLVLWESDNQSVNEIADKLVLNTNTLTPLLKRLEKQGLIYRRRSDRDERKVYIELTEDGRKLKSRATKIPEALVQKLDLPDMDVIEVKRRVDELLHRLRSTVVEAE